LDEKVSKHTEILKTKKWKWKTSPIDYIEQKKEYLDLRKRLGKFYIQKEIKGKHKRA
jgi:hypothetical protein